MYCLTLKLKPKCCCRLYLTLVEKTKTKPQKWCQATTLLIKRTCKMPAFPPAVCATIFSRICFVLLQQQQKSRTSLTSRTKGGGHGLTKIWNSFYRRNQIVFDSSASERDGWSPHSEIHERDGMEKFSKSSTACPFSKHEVKKILSKNIIHRFKTNKAING